MPELNEVVTQDEMGGVTPALFIFHFLTCNQINSDTRAILAFPDTPTQAQSAAQAFLFLIRQLQ